MFQFENLENMPPKKAAVLLPGLSNLTLPNLSILAFSNK
jgi:hypothetical protein